MAVAQAMPVQSSARWSSAWAGDNGGDQEPTDRLRPAGKPDYRVAEGQHRHGGTPAGARTKGCGVV